MLLVPQHLVDCSTYELDLSVYRFDLTRYLDGQPLQVCRSTARLRPRNMPCFPRLTARPVSPLCCACWLLHRAEHLATACRKFMLRAVSTQEEFLAPLDSL